MDGAAKDNEKRLNGTLSELEKAEAALAELERICKAPRGKYVTAPPDEIAAAQKALPP